MCRALLLDAVNSGAMGLLLFTGWVQPNLLGYMFVAGQAAFVAVMAEREFIGMRKSTAAIHARQ